MRYPSLAFDDLEVAAAFVCGPRAVTREDVSAFAGLSGDKTALHTDEGYAAKTPFGGIVSHGVLNLAIATGLAYDMGIFDGTVLAIRSMEVSYDRPVRPGDSLTLRLEVEALEERPRPDRGRATFAVSLLNQTGRVVLSGRWHMLIRRLTGPPTDDADPDSTSFQIKT